MTNELKDLSSEELSARIHRAHANLKRNERKVREWRRRETALIQEKARREDGE